MTILGNTPELLGGLSGEEAGGCCTKVGGINPRRGIENSLIIVQGGLDPQATYHFNGCC